LTPPLDRLRSTLNPEQYHGASGARPFFEGWYYKLIDPSERSRYAIIPGISRGADSARDHAFVQIFDGATGRVEYVEYPVGEFASAPDRFDISIGPNRFTRRSISLDVNRNGIVARGRLAFHDTVPWPVTLTSPGVMGWYAWIPFMECYHGVVSLDHRIEGSLSVFGESVDFTGGRGYAEKDWGRAFPEAYVWFQSNHFRESGTSLTASIAVIPWVRTAFPGFIVGLWHARTLHPFATYTGAWTEALEIGDREIAWTIRDRRRRLELRLAREAGGLLRAPTTLTMDRRIVEALGATAQVRLEEVGGRKEIIFAGTGRHGGLEAAGDLARLVELQRPRR
jgi:tocopherol cyclase